MKKFNFKSFSKHPVEPYSKNQSTIYNINNINSKKASLYKKDSKQSNKINLLTTLEKILAPENKELLNTLIEIKKSDTIAFNKNLSLSELEINKINSEIYISTLASLNLSQNICWIFNFNIIRELEVNLNPHAEMLVAYQTIKKIKPHQENRSKIVNQVMQRIEDLENLVGKYHYYLSLNTEKQINDIQISSLNLKFTTHNYEKILKQFLDQSTLILIEKIILEEQIMKTTLSVPNSSKNPNKI